MRTLPVLAVVLTPALLAAGCADDPAGTGACPAPGPVTVVAAEERRLPQVASAPDGGALAAWETVTGDPVEAAAMTPDGRWGAPRAVSERYAARPRVAALPGGAAVVVWDGRSPAGGSAARVAERAADGTWSAGRDLGGAGRRGRWWPDAAAGPDGRVVAAWTAGGSGLWVAERAPGGGWTAARDTGLARARVFDLAVAAGPRTAVAWLEERGDGRVVRASVRDGSGRWGPARDLSPEGTANDPRVAVAPDGGVLVAWRRDTAGDRQVVEVAELSGGRWRTTSVGAEAPRGRGLPRPPGAGSIAPRLATGDGGLAVVAWPSREGTAERVRVAVRPPGGAWTPERPVGSAGGAGAPDVAVTADTALVAWEDLDGVRLGLRVASVDGRAVRCCAAPGAAGQEVAAPVLAPLPGGRALAVWNGSNRGSVEAAVIAPC